MALKESVEVTKKCKTCGKEFKRITKMPWIPKFCSDFCSNRDYRKRHKEEEKDRVYRWRRNNKEKYNASHRVHYKYNKSECNSRTHTNKFLNKYPNEAPEYKCKACHCDVKLFIHHEVYPNTFSEIRDAIKDGKIYYLCQKHHDKLHNKLNGFKK